MVLNCNSDIKVLSKYAKSANNGKTYFHLIVCNFEGGEPADLGCSTDVFNKVIECKCYNVHFGLNPFYLRKEYSCNINIDSVSECILDKSMKGEK